MYGAGQKDELDQGAHVGLEEGVLQKQRCVLCSQFWTTQVIAHARRLGQQVRVHENWLDRMQSVLVLVSNLATYPEDDGREGEHDG